jgi:hypothetical protein
MLSIYWQGLLLSESLTCTHIWPVCDTSRIRQRDNIHTDNEQESCHTTTSNMIKSLVFTSIVMLVFTLVENSLEDQLKTALGNNEQYLKSAATEATVTTSSVSISLPLPTANNERT